MADVSELADWIRFHRDDLVHDLVRYASIETPSDDRELLAQGLVFVEDWLTRLVGSPTDRRTYSVEGFGDTVVLDFESTRPGRNAPAEEWVSVLCHYDTVWAQGTLAERPVAVNGDRVTGPGVFDMKAGLVQFAWAVAAIDALELPRPGIRLVLNGDEEIGSRGSRSALEQEVLKGGPVLVFEASADGALKTARKGVGLFDIEVIGVEAHAGLEPLAGASAIDEMARIILTLHDATDLDAGTSVNVGVVSGGTRANVKAGHATANIDVRVRSAEESTRIDGVLASLQPRSDLARIVVTGAWNRPVMERTTATAALFERAREAAEPLGIELRETAVGGASDGNFASALGLPVLDGLGAVGAGAHARHEWVSIDGMLERSTLAAALLVTLA